MLPLLLAPRHQCLLPQPSCYLCMCCPGYWFPQQLCLLPLLILAVLPWLLVTLPTAVAAPAAFFAAAVEGLERPGKEEQPIKLNLVLQMKIKIELLRKYRQT